MTAPMTRKRAAARMVEVLDSAFLRALTEPSRLELLKLLLISGPADIGTIAEQLPQDRSVISRHLKVLEEAGVVRGQKDGRHRIYEIDGATFMATLETIVGETRSLAAVCCPPAASDTSLVPVSQLRRR
jgi:DNA-binding transcriptional ArsR family regulator